MSERYTRNFTVAEFASKDGLDGHKRMDPEFMTRLQVLRDLWGDSLVITSGIRSREHNEAVGGSPSSWHLKGLAADISLKGFSGHDRWQLIGLVFSLGFTGIGVSGDFLHLDLRPGLESTWTY